MEKVILDFLSKENIGALTTMIDKDLPHAAALHFSYSEKTGCFYFSTDKTSRKASFLLMTHTTHGALVIGLSEETWITFQLEGIVQIVPNGEELEEAKQIHYGKHPGSKRFENDPDTIFLVFKPQWYRYTDFNKKPLEIIEWEAEEKV